MTDNIAPLVTAGLVIFAMLFVASGIFLILRQWMRYYYRKKVNDAEKGAMSLGFTLQILGEQHDTTSLATQETGANETYDYHLVASFPQRPTSIVHMARQQRHSRPVEPVWHGDVVDLVSQPSPEGSWRSATTIVDGDNIDKPRRREL